MNKPIWTGGAAMLDPDAQPAKLTPDGQHLVFCVDTERLVYRAQNRKYNRMQNPLWTEEVVTSCT